MITMSKKFSELTPSDFPGVDPQKFEEWRSLHSRATIALLLGMLVWGTGLVTVPLIGGGIGYALPIVFWFGYMFAVVRPLSNAEKKLGTTLGIEAALRRRSEVQPPSSK